MDRKSTPAEIEAELTEKERVDIEELDMRDVGQVSQGIYRIAKALAQERRRLRECREKSEERRVMLGKHQWMLKRGDVVVWDNPRTSMWYGGFGIGVVGKPPIKDADCIWLEIGDGEEEGWPFWEDELEYMGRL